jgi:hypothetical protein
MRTITSSRIKKITYKGIEDVYNMEVEGTHCFSVNGGYIVHNCRYATEYIWRNMENTYSYPMYGLSDIGL